MYCFVVRNFIVLSLAEGETATATYFSSFSFTTNDRPPVELRVKTQLTSHTTTAVGDIRLDCEILVGHVMFDITSLGSTYTPLSDTSGFIAKLASNDTVVISTSASNVATVAVKLQVQQVGL